MRTLTGRVTKLEHRFWPDEGKPQILLVACHAGWGLALNMDTCVGILGECGFLPTSRIGLLDLLHIPDGLGAKELQRFLREQGAELRGPKDIQNRDSLNGSRK